MTINRYTRDVILQRQVADTVDRGALQNAGKLAAAAGELAFDVGSRMQEAEEKAWLNETLIKKQRAETDRLYATRTQATDSPRGYSALFEQESYKLDQELAKGAPTERSRKAFEQAAKEDNFRTYQQNKEWEFKASVEAFDRKYKTMGDDLKNITSIRAKNGEDFDFDVINQVDALTVGASDIYSPEQLQVFNEKLRQEVFKAHIDGLNETDPFKAKDELENGVFAPSALTGGFDEAMAFVMREETGGRADGGFVANDGGRGPSIYGVNSEANPKEYAEIKALQDAGKPKEAEALAKKTYFDKYWKAIDADNLSPQMQMLAFDAAVNQGQGAARQMLKESGGDVDKFVALRAARYEKTAQNPEKAENLKGWMNRLARVQTKVGGGALPFDEAMKLKNAAEAEIERNNAVNRVNLGNEFETLRKAAELGADVSDEQLLDIETRAANLGMEAQVAQVQEYRRNSQHIKTFAGMTARQQQHALIQAEIDAEQGGTAEREKFVAYQTAYQAKEKAIQEDAWAYYQQAGFTKKVGNLSDDLQGEVAKRLAGAETVQQRDGRSLPILTPQEVAGLKEQFDRGDTKAVSDFITSVNAAMGDNPAASNVRAETARVLSATSPVLAAAMVTDRETSARIIAGAKIEGVKVEQKKVTTVVNNKIGAAIQDPSVLKSTHAAIYAYYKQMAAESGTMSEPDPDEDIVEAAISAIVGKVESVSIGGPSSAIIVPKDMSSNELEDVFGSIDDSVAAQIGLSGAYTAQMESIDFTELVDNARLYTTGDGRYGFILEGIGYVLNAKGQPYEVDVRAVREKLKGVGPTGRSFKRQVTDSPFVSG